MKRRKSQQRERDRMQIRIIEQIASPTLSFELENFNLYGKLRKTQTEIHNTLPSPESKLIINVVFFLNVITPGFITLKSFFKG